MIQFLYDSLEESSTALPAIASLIRNGYMKTDFELGDLVKFKPASSSLRRPKGLNNLVVVTRLLPASKKFFYGRVCSTWEEYLWSYDQFYLLQKAGN